MEDGGALLHACAADVRGPGKIGAVLRVLTTAARVPRLARGLLAPGGASAAFPNTAQRLPAAHLEKDANAVVIQCNKENPMGVNPGHK